jgi:phenol hydroxylase P3 protein
MDTFERIHQGKINGFVMQGFNPLAAVLDYYHINVGADNGEFNGSPDQVNWDRWTGQDTSGERRAPPEQEAIVA